MQSETTARVTKREHVELLALVEQVEQAPSGQAQEGKHIPGTDARQQTQNEAYARLCTRALAHFAAEESPGGLLAEALLRVPNRSAEIEALIAEHQTMRELLDESGEPEAVRSLCSMIRTHERKEADLLASLWYSEPSVAD